jgi:TrmH RNA methyltransferase
MPEPNRHKRPVAATERVYGLAAALAVLRNRPEQVVNIAHTANVRRALGSALSDAARRKIAYREVGDEELARMAGSVHHEGVCLLVRERALVSLAELARRAEPSGLLVALDRVTNPHNVGAVLRSAAFFGVPGMLLADTERPLLTAAATRVAEGGAEHVGVAHVAALVSALGELRSSGFVVVGADASAEVTLPALRWPTRVVLVLGSEDQGMSAAVKQTCDQLVRIDGGGAMESLNVSVAAGVLLASYQASQREIAPPK